MARKRHLGVRIDAELKEEFLRLVHEKGLSTCYVLEGLIRGWIEGVKTKNSSVKQSSTIHVHQQHVVRRLRRYASGDPGSNPGGREKTNHYDPFRGWYYDATLEPGEIVVEQPREWGKNRCAEGFIWVESRRLWWKKS